MNIKLVILFASLSALLFASCVRGDRSQFIGAWKAEDSDALVVFFGDGSCLFTFLNIPSDGVLQDWHHKGTWVAVEEGHVKVTYLGRDSLDQAPESEVKSINFVFIESLIKDSNNHWYDPIK